MTIAALLLAAGESTRMGRLKQLLDWDGKPLVAWQAEQLREAGAGDIVVVLGHAAEEIRPLVPAFARVAVNAAYRQGRATSLKCGAEALPDDTEGVLILSVDQPRPAWLARRLIERWRRGRDASATGEGKDAAATGEGRDASVTGEGRPLVVSPRFVRGYGHPILVDGALLPELRAVEDATFGLRAVIDVHVDEAVSVRIDDAAVDVDLNTPSDYEAALASFMRGEWAQTK